MWVLINGLCKPSLGAVSHMTKILQAENGQKVYDFELIYLSMIITDFDGKGFVVFEHIVNRLSFGYVRLPQLEYYLSFLFSYFFFLILLWFSTFKLFNALYSRCE